MVGFIAAWTRVTAKMSSKATPAQLISSTFESQSEK
jgi:hypothetical protein